MVRLLVAWTLVVLSMLSTLSVYANQTDETSDTDDAEESLDAPYYVVSTPLDDGTIRVTWNYPYQGAAGFVVYRDAGTDDQWVELTRVDSVVADQGEYIDQLAQVQDGAYRYRVCAFSSQLIACTQTIPSGTDAT